MKCKICDNDTKMLFKGTVLVKHEAEYFYCEKKYSMNLYSNKEIHLFTKKKINRLLFKLLTGNGNSLLFLLNKKMI